jgi:hypothetical protein
MRAVTPEEIERIFDGIQARMPKQLKSMLKKAPGGPGGGQGRPPPTISGWPVTSLPGTTVTGGGGGDHIDNPTYIGHEHATPDGRHVTISYQATPDGTSSDQLVSESMNTALDKILDSDKSITKTDISDTTNGGHKYGVKR